VLHHMAGVQPVDRSAACEAVASCDTPAAAASPDDSAG
jgi:hypothetical protein